MSLKLPKILYFTAGVVPTITETREAAEMKANVMFRTSDAFGEGQGLETCDGVAGAAPKAYVEKFGTAEAAIKRFETALKKLSESVGDEPAPKKPKNAEKPEEPKTAAPGQQPDVAAWSPNV